MDVRELALLALTRHAVATGEAKQLRLAHKLTLSNIADTCQVDQVTVWRWENGLRSPRPQTALRYGRVLELLRGIPNARTALELQSPVSLSTAEGHR
ncbi:MAG: helix-turn-helix transcriptional regulator [Leifsonia sp.]